MATGRDRWAHSSRRLSVFLDVAYAYMNHGLDYLLYSRNLALKVTSEEGFLDGMYSPFQSGFHGLGASSPRQFYVEGVLDWRRSEGRKG